MDFFNREVIRFALKEDIGHGDITSNLVVDDREVTAKIVAKEPLVLAGMPFVKEVFDILGGAAVEIFFDEGSRLKKGDIIAGVSGCARAILAGERTALNILQRLSGIATYTAAFVEKVKDLGVKIVDTRKTSPGMRYMEKYAVAAGGGLNHRFGLFDGVLIKDNHIAIAGGIKEPVKRARLSAGHLLKIEVEAKNIGEALEAVEAGADVIMLDNMSIAEMREAVASIKNLKRSVLIEASGNVNLDNVRDIADTGVDIISVGSITHSARAVDISMKIS